MIPVADLWTVSYIVAGIVVVATAAGVAVPRLLAARSIGTILTVIAAVAFADMLAGVVLIAKVMFISHEDLDAVDRGCGHHNRRLRRLAERRPTATGSNPSAAWGSAGSGN